jgi:hypothetical protein
VVLLAGWMGGGRHKVDDAPERFLAPSAATFAPTPISPNVKLSSALPPSTAVPGLHPRLFYIYFLLAARIQRRLRVHFLILRKTLVVVWLVVCLATPPIPGGLGENILLCPAESISFFCVLF